MKCVEEPLESFQTPNSTINYEKSEKTSFFSPDTWSKYINPANWFNGIDNWQEAVVMVITILVFLVVLGVVLKVVHVFSCCIQCLKCSRKLCCCLPTKSTKKKHKKRPKVLPLLKSPEPPRAEVPRPLQSNLQCTLVSPKTCLLSPSTNRYQYPALTSSLFDSHGSYRLNTENFLSRKEAEVKNEARRLMNLRVRSHSLETSEPVFPLALASNHSNSLSVLQNVTSYSPINQRVVYRHSPISPLAHQRSCSRSPISSALSTSIQSSPSRTHAVRLAPMRNEAKDLNLVLPMDLMNNGGSSSTSRSSSVEKEPARQPTCEGSVFKFDSLSVSKPYSYSPDGSRVNLDQLNPLKSPMKSPFDKTRTDPPPSPLIMTEFGLA